MKGRLLEVHYRDAGAVGAIARCVSEMPHPLVVMCVGTDRVTGDCVGPLVGSYLKRVGVVPVFGTVDEPVTAVNLGDVHSVVRRTHPGVCILAVDACVSRPGKIGSICVWRGPLRAGSGTGKMLAPFGDMSITANVAARSGGVLDVLVLHGVRLQLVMDMARVVFRGIWHGIALREGVAAEVAMADGV
mgnify:CR=1 FL=1